MVIVVCTDDQNLIQLAAQASVGNHVVFGDYFTVFADRIPRLGRNEDLFILAHGAKYGDDGNPVIGDREGAFYLNAVQLWEQLATLFPVGYRARIFVSACQSYDPGADSLSFAEMLTAVVQAHFEVKVYGHAGSVNGPLPIPGDRAWLPAAGTHGNKDITHPATESMEVQVALPQAAGGDDPNGTMMKQLYSKIADVVSVGSSIEAPGHSFLVLASPGIFLDPSLDLNNADDQALWASVLNRIPLPNFIFGDSGQSLDGLFDIILQGKELPLVRLSPSQQKQLDAALAVVYTADGDPTPQFQKYQSYQAAYYEALTTYQEAQAEAKNNGVPIPPNVTNAWKTAKTNWEMFGYRTKIDNAVATINNLQGLDPNSWWQKLSDRFDLFQIQASSGTFAFTNTFPKYESIFGDKGWSTFQFNQGDYQNQEINKSINAGGGLAANWGLFRASAEATYAKDEGFKKSSSVNLNVSVELLRLQINRPWLDSLVLRSRAWRWSPNSPLSEPISNGVDASSGDTPSGVMPLFPTSLIVARNFTLSGDFKQEELQWMQEQINANASFGWGPFSISGSYNQTTGENRSEGHLSGTTVSNPDPQLIGWLCNVLPACPNPDPNLKWPTDMRLDHIPEYRAEFIAKIAAMRSKARILAKSAKA